MFVELRASSVTWFVFVLGVALACSPKDSDVVRQASAEGSEPANSSTEAVGSDATTRDTRAVVLFVGTSLTAGYGLTDVADAYPAQIQIRIDAAGLPFRVVNAGVSGDTSAGGLRRMESLLEEPVSVLVLELGANDGLRGLPVDQLATNLQSAIDAAETRHTNITVVLVGMEAPTNMGSRYTDAFRAVYTDLAEANDATLVPFLLEGVAGIAEMNQDDRIHPSAKGHGIVAETVWVALEPVLSARASGVANTAGRF